MFHVDAMVIVRGPFFVKSRAKFVLRSTQYREYANWDRLGSGSPWARRNGERGDHSTSNSHIFYHRRGRCGLTIAHVHVTRSENVWYSQHIIWHRQRSLPSQICPKQANLPHLGVGAVRVKLAHSRHPKHLTVPGVYWEAPLDQKAKNAFHMTLESQPKARKATNVLLVAPV